MYAYTHVDTLDTCVLIVNYLHIESGADAFSNIIFTDIHTQTHE